MHCCVFYPFHPRWIFGLFPVFGYIISNAVINLLDCVFSCYTVLNLGVELPGQRVGVCLCSVDEVQLFSNSFPLAVMSFLIALRLLSTCQLKKF